METTTKACLLEQLSDLIGQAFHHEEDLTYMVSIRERPGRGKPLAPSERNVGTAYFYSFRTRAANFVGLLERFAPHLASTRRMMEQMPGTPESAEEIKGILEGLYGDIEDGLLDRIAQTIEDNVVADYLAMAEQLFAGERGPLRHVPAAVMAGSVLEDGLRRLCLRQRPPIDTTKANGAPKTMGALIDELKAAGLYNELKAKQLRAWADIRNAAAHGRFDDFSAADVEHMLAGIASFLGDYL